MSHSPSPSSSPQPGSAHSSSSLLSSSSSSTASPRHVDNATDDGGDDMTGHDAPTEHTPLLAAAPVFLPLHKPDPPSRHHILLLSAILVLILETAGCFREPPSNAILEHILCQKAHADLDLDLRRAALDPRCKAPDVQGRMASLQGWRIMTDGIPVLLCTVPYGMLADRWGRKLVMALSVLGGVLAWGAKIAIYALPQVFPVELSLGTSLFMFIGGSSSVTGNMLFTLLTDVVPQAERSAVFVRLSAIYVLPSIIASPLAALLMTRSPWIPLTAGWSLQILAFFVCFAFPDTLDTLPVKRKPPPSPVEPRDPVPRKTGVRADLRRPQAPSYGTTAFAEPTPPISPPHSCLRDHAAAAKSVSRWPIANDTGDDDDDDEEPGYFPASLVEAAAIDHHPEPVAAVESPGLFPLRRCLFTRAIDSSIKVRNILIYGNPRAALLAFATVIVVLGRFTQSILPQYTTERFHWTWSKATLLLSIQDMASLFTLSVVVPGLGYICRKHLHMTPFTQDVWLTRLSCVCMIVGTLMVALAPSPALLVIALSIFSLSDSFSSLSRSLLIALVDGDSANTNTSPSSPHSPPPSPSYSPTPTDPLLPSTPSSISSSSSPLPPKSNASLVISLLSVSESVVIMAAAPALAHVFRLGLAKGGLWTGMPFVAAAGMFLGALGIFVLGVGGERGV